MELKYNILKTKKKEGNDKHHIFTIVEVREKILQVIDEPITEKEIKIFNRLVKKYHNLMPRLNIPRELHKNIHNNATGVLPFGSLN